jgi:hypothetical protein
VNSLYSIILIITIVVIFGAILGVGFFRRNKHTGQLHDTFGSEYDHTVETLGNEKKAQTELDNRQKHVQTLDIHPLSASQQEQYLTNWTAVQSKFVDEPGPAIMEADRLIMEVMQVRNYPISDFEQRAADISVGYPNLVGNYRAAREIALKNKQGLANTEEMRQAMIYYRSLFEELLKTEPVGVQEKI